VAVRRRPHVCRLGPLDLGVSQSGTRRSAGVIAMSDFAIAGLLIACLIALAIMAPIWGYDSHDGVGMAERP
jgi:hypothetical protein